MGFDRGCKSTQFATVRDPGVGRPVHIDQQSGAKVASFIKRAQQLKACSGQERLENRPTERRRKLSRDNRLTGLRKLQLYRC